MITVGTFNLNNLFSRYNFKGEVDAIKDGKTNVNSSFQYKFEEGDHYRLRTYKGKLVKGKEQKETAIVADRILKMNVDVLGVQEVEDIDTLKAFNRKFLKQLYPYQVLIEGNDKRLIDVGFLSKFPIGAITSWQAVRDPKYPGQKLFGRDLLQVEILNKDGSLLFTAYNTHLKSHYVDWREEDQEAAYQRANDLRSRQCKGIAEVLARHGAKAPYVVLGDMNDPPDSKYLAPLTKVKGITNALTNAQETRPPKADNPPPSSPVWTHRYKRSGEPAEYHLYDQIWVSAKLSKKLGASYIDRRTKHSGDGSDHDPAWIELNL